MEVENLIRLIGAVSESNLTGLKYEEDGVKIHLTKKKDQVQVMAAPVGNVGAGMAETVMAAPFISASGSGAEDGAVSAGNAGDTVTVNTDGKLIESPLVGTFYAAPSEDAAPFVAVGDTVKKGQPLAIIEAMKLMNEIESEYDGTVVEILVENGQPVEYGQPLFRIR